MFPLESSACVNDLAPADAPPSRPLKPIGGDRWSVITDLIGASPGAVVDIGCRDRKLADHLPPGARYVGVDLGPPADIVASAEDPLPFANDEFDTAVLADVLEHLENPHHALREAMRVASGQVVVLLPNMYSLLHRLRYLGGRTLAKYEFGPNQVVDRHRWLMTARQAQAFCVGVAQSAGWCAVREYGFDGGFRRPSVRAAHALARGMSGPNLWAWEYVARLEPAS